MKSSGHVHRWRSIVANGIHMWMCTICGRKMLDTTPRWGT